MGWITPFVRIGLASSCKRSGSNTRRGWSGLGSVSSTRTRLGVCGVGAGWAAASSALIDDLAGRRALRPFPSALRGPSCGLFIGEYLLGQLDVAFRAL